MTCDIIFLCSRSALNEKSLERYLESLLGDQKRLGMLYDDWAFLRYGIAYRTVLWIRIRFGSEIFSRIRIR
jgi:hypothetical protein